MNPHGPEPAADRPLRVLASLEPFLILLVRSRSCSIEAISCSSTNCSSSSLARAAVTMRFAMERLLAMAALLSVS